MEFNDPIGVSLQVKNAFLFFRLRKRFFQLFFFCSFFLTSSASSRSRERGYSGAEESPKTTRVDCNGG